MFISDAIFLTFVTGLLGYHFFRLFYSVLNIPLGVFLWVDFMYLYTDHFYFLD